MRKFPVSRFLPLSGWGSALLATASIFLGMLLFAQEPERKLLKKVEPQYPKILRERSIGGTVRLRVTVEAGGEVSKVEVLGGNPVLVEQAEAAVKHWRYEPAPKASVTEVKIVFDPKW